MPNYSISDLMVFTIIYLTKPSLFNKGDPKGKKKKKDVKMLYEGIVSHKHINGFLQFNTSARMRELRLPVDFSLDITSQLLSLVISTG